MSIMSWEARRSAFMPSFPVMPCIWSYIITLCFSPAGTEQLSHLVRLHIDIWVAHPSQDPARLPPPGRASTPPPALSERSDDDCFYRGRLIATSCKRLKWEIYESTWPILLPHCPLGPAFQGTRTRFSSSASSAVFSQEREAQRERLAAFLIALTVRAVWSRFALPFHYF